MWYYHGSSTEGITTLKRDTYVTPYMDDALIFAIRWGTDDIDWKKTVAGRDGRPPKALVFKKVVVIDDHPIYLYVLENPPVKSTPTNMGVSYDWNKKITKDHPVKLLLKADSWKHVLEIGVNSYIHSQLNTKPKKTGWTYTTW